MSISIKQVEEVGNKIGSGYMWPRNFKQSVKFSELIFNVAKSSEMTIE